MRKTADTAAAEAHIRNLENIRRELTALYEKAGMELNNCRLDRDGIKLEYLEGITLGGEAGRASGKRRDGEAEELFFFYLKKIEHIHSRDVFRKTREFVEVFGDARLPKVSAQAVSPISTCSRQYSDPGGQSSGAGITSGRSDSRFPAILSCTG